MAQLHEYKAKQILSAHGIEIPRGQVAFSPQEARQIAENLGGEVVVKAQIHSTSRAAAGGIKFASNADEAEKIAAEMLGKKIGGNLCEAVLVDEKAEIVKEFYLGFIVDTTLKRPVLLFSESGGSGIEERAESMRKMVCSIRQEPKIEELVQSFGSSRDESSFTSEDVTLNLEPKVEEPVQSFGSSRDESSFTSEDVILNPEPKVEESVQSFGFSRDEFSFTSEDVILNPEPKVEESVQSFGFSRDESSFTSEDVTLNLEPKVEESVQSFGFSRDESSFTSEDVILNIAEILQKLYRVAKATDARTAEINPLALLKDGRLVALDCRISVDDYAEFRQKNLDIEIARELGHTPTKLEKIAWEIEKDDFRGTFYFVEIPDADEKGIKIGFHGAGGGGSMASLDAAQRNGLSPACYVDTSGNPPASKVYRAARIILSIPNIRGYFLSGSGVASQEQFGLARAVLKAFLEVKPKIPAVLRLGGNGEDIAKELVEKYAKFLPAPVEAYQKIHSADFCAARLRELIDAETSSKGSTEKFFDGKFAADYEFRTKTGKVSFDYSKLNRDSAEKIVASCPQKILKTDENGNPILAISTEDAEKGKCSECLACEFASWDLGLNAVKIEFPIEGL